MAWKYMEYHINKSDPGHTPLKQQLEKNLKITFVNPCIKGNENEN